MKVKTEHYVYITKTLDSIKPLILQTQKVYKQFGLSDMRLRWDIARHAGLIPFFCSSVYQYANDEHIDTALRQYFKKLGA
jgi:hypothetical protein